MFKVHLRYFCAVSFDVCWLCCSEFWLHFTWTFRMAGIRQICNSLPNIDFSYTIVCDVKCSWIMIMYVSFNVQYLPLISCNLWHFRVMRLLSGYVARAPIQQYSHLAFNDKQAITTIITKQRTVTITTPEAAVSSAEKLCCVKFSFQCLKLVVVYFAQHQHHD